MAYKPNNEAFKYVNDTHHTIGTIKYALDWRYGRTVRKAVVPWLSTQVDYAIESGMFDDVVYSIMNNTSVDNYDAIAIKCLRWVNKNIKYVSDSDKFGSPEVWEDVINVFETKEGDCESGAMLLYVLMRMCGISENRMFISCGSVQGGGHAFLCYKPMYSPIHFTFCDWCYNYDSSVISKREWFFVTNGNKIYSMMTGESDEFYHKAWWFFNETSGYFYVNNR